MKVSLIVGLIGNSCLLQKESLNGGTAQMVESRGKEGGKKRSKDFNKVPSPFDKCSVVTIQTD